MRNTKKLPALIATVVWVAGLAGCNAGNESMSKEDVKTMSGGGMRTAADNKLMADKIAAFYKMHPEYHHSDGGMAGTSPGMK